MAVTALIDTNIILNAKNGKEIHSEYSLHLLDAVEDGLVHGIISVISVAELCTGYYSQGDMRGKEEFLAHLMSSKNFTVVELSLEISDAAARIRADTGLRLPDAIIIATGLAKNAQYLVTNDKELKKAGRYLKVASPKELLSRTCNVRAKR